MKLIVGLGNPGTEYAKTRHNFGWMMLDRLARDLGASWQTKTKFQSQVAETAIDDEKILLVKPTTFYNLSGIAIRAVRDFYQLDNRDILVVHDEMALPIGAIRTRVGGSDAGNNGIKSLIEHLGPDFAKIRIGSGQAPGANGDARPTEQHRDHVLSRPTASEADLLDTLEPHIRHIITEFAGGHFLETTHSVNS